MPDNVLSASKSALHFGLGSAAKLKQSIIDPNKLWMRAAGWSAGRIRQYPLEPPHQGQPGKPEET
jgi:hypothetical protein